MADWIAPVITGVVGLAGIVATWQTGKDSRDHAERTAEHASQAALKLSLANKRYDAYVRILQIGFKVQQWVDLMQRHLADQSFKKPTEDDEAAWAELNALAAAFSSKPVADAFKGWRNASMECRTNAAKYIRRHQSIVEHGGVLGTQPEDLYDLFKQSASKANDAYKLLANRINIEATRSD